MLSLKSEVILVVSSPALKAAKDNSDTVPIVFVGVTGPVNKGFVADLSHPGGNVTGFTSFDFSIGSKWLQLLKEMSPRLRHFALIFNPEATAAGWLPLFKSAAPVVGLEVTEAAVVVDNNNLDEIAMDALKTTSDAGMIVLLSPFTMLHVRQS